MRTGHSIEVGLQHPIRLGGIRDENVDVAQQFGHLANQEPGPSSSWSLRANAGAVIR
ncbi:hypothetical protein [Nocardia sp. CDC160]|uniref:hypothetical protein n=1 Tax=Nocardia sp. CDC160 TaxID=3112166 RepID=UPI002DBA26C5|nr:hypothetical protein [Nocardia sp. CDC160]MEC3916790.1 hypothetical protein [Nocardia sp. CDC160]